MKDTIYAIYLFLSSVSLFSQSLIDNRRDNTWCLGYGGDSMYAQRMEVAFTTGEPFVKLKGNIVAIIFESNASISDTSGNLLFYSNGMRVFNKDHVIMENGDSINCCGAAWGFDSNIWEGSRLLQNCLIIPIWGLPNRYYLIYKFVEDNSIGTDPYKFSELRYAIIDMSFNNGLGKVVQKNIPFMVGHFEENLVTLCRHANGRDWWLLQRDYYSTLFHRILISPSGFQEVGTQTIGSPHADVLGQARFSPDGKKFVTWGMHDYSVEGAILEIFDFDRCTGLLSHAITQHYFGPDLLQAAGGCEISANSRYLYTTLPTSVYQYDLQAQDIIASRQKVATYDEFRDTIINFIAATSILYCQKGPDDKIYISAGPTRYLHVIESPDSGGVACNVNQHGFYLSRVNAYSIPNFPNFRLGPLVGSACDTLTSIERGTTGTSKSIIIYPNPSNETVNIALQGQTSIIGQLSIHDTYGRIVTEMPFEAETGKIELQVENWTKGMYFVTLKTNEASYVGKLIIGQ